MSTNKLTIFKGSNIHFLDRIICARFFYELRAWFDYDMSSSYPMWWVAFIYSAQIYSKYFSFESLLPSVYCILVWTFWLAGCIAIILFSSFDLCSDHSKIQDYVYVQSFVALFATKMMTPSLLLYQPSAVSSLKLYLYEILNYSFWCTVLRSGQGTKRLHLLSIATCFLCNTLNI